MENPTKKKPYIVRGLICLAIVASGLMGMGALARIKEPPEELYEPEFSLTVDVVTALMEEVRTLILGYGEVRTRITVEMAPEVSGRVIAIHPELEPGGIVQKGSILFQIDSQTLTLKKKGTTRRIEALKRNRDLLKKEFVRVQTLFNKAQTGSLANVEAAEQNYNTARDNVAQLEQELSLIDLDLERSVIRAPFTGRIKSVNVEVGQYISSGTPALTLADDTLLEIVVPIKGEKAVRFLNFKESAKTTPWFPPLKKSRASILWSGGLASARGTLDRITRYDAATRTFFVSVLVTPQDQGEVPIAEGMFCRVTIPGRTLANVFPLPRTAVTPDGRVHLAKDGQLKSVAVETVYQQAETLYVSSGLTDGDLVITNRLASPVQGTPLTLSSKKDSGKETGEPSDVPGRSGGAS